MCGIVGAVSTRNIVPILVQGLQRLEYRGYDSCGVAVHSASLGAKQGGSVRDLTDLFRVGPTAFQCSKKRFLGKGIECCL